MPSAFVNPTKLVRPLTLALGQFVGILAKANSGLRNRLVKTHGWATTAVSPKNILC